MKTRIAVDIDGVIAIHHDQTCDQINNYFGVTLPTLPTDYDFTVSYERECGLSPQDVKEFLVRLFRDPDYLDTFAPFLPMMRTLKLLAGMSVDPAGVTILTSRHADMKERTKQWINGLGIAYHTIVHTHDKATYCREKGVRYLVEDSPGYALSCASIGVGVFLLDWPFNRNVLATGSNGIWRVKNPLDIPALIQRDLQETR